MTMEARECCRIGIVDYGLGNLFSIQQGVIRSGMQPFISSNAHQLASADGVILPGVGAFGDAMEALRQCDLIDPLKDFAKSGKPVMGVCLGMQLMMEESVEFGRHQGLGLFPGTVERLTPNVEIGDRYKVPHIGWSHIQPPGGSTAAKVGVPVRWCGTLLDGLSAGEYVYFVHTFRVGNTTPEAILATTTYGGDTYCSAIERDNVSAFQFHPEKSGAVGLRIYQNFATRVALSVLGDSGSAGMRSNSML